MSTKTPKKLSKALLEKNQTLKIESNLKAVCLSV
jgi:hypothetical protein